MNLELDHVVVFVPDLGAASRAFEALGFHVEAGGDHGPTENALIPFENDVYIELIALKSKGARWMLKALNRLGFSRRKLYVKDNVMGRIMGWFSQSYGPVDWCVRWATESNEPQTTAEQFNLTPPREFTRQKPDGSMLHWTLASPKIGGLPMFIKDTTATHDRLPEWRDGIHTNSAREITQLRLPKDAYHRAAQYMKTDDKGDFTLGSITLVPDGELLKAAFGLQISYTGQKPNLIAPEHACGLAIEFVLADT
ncbi:MAG: VOC family protein [Maricaulaceae bacterium]